MCGRCSVGCSLDAICAAGGVARSAVPADISESYVPCQNVAPNCKVPAIYIARNSRRELDLMFWGMKRGSPTDRSPLVNVMVENFRSSSGMLRCIVFIDGFYEWKSTPGGKLPFYFYHREGALLALACIYKREEDCKFSILTTSSSKQIKWLHDRQPVILPPHLMARWLDSGDAGVIDDIQKGAADSRMIDDCIVYHSVSTKVSNVQYRGSDCNVFLKNDTKPLTQFFKPQSPNAAASPTKVPASSCSSDVILDLSREQAHSAPVHHSTTQDSVSSSTTLATAVSSSSGDTDDRVLCPLCQIDLTNLTAGSRNSHAASCDGPASSSSSSPAGKRHVSTDSASTSRTPGSADSRNKKMKSSSSSSASQITNFFSRSS